MLLSMPTGTNSLRERLSNQVAAIIPILTPYPYWVGLPKTFFSRLLGRWLAPLAGPGRPPAVPGPSGRTPTNRCRPGAAVVGRPDLAQTPEGTWRLRFHLHAGC